MLSQGAVNFYTNLKFEAAAVEPPNTPYPTPNLLAEPGNPHNADVKRAIETDNARQRRYGVKKQYPLVARMATTHLRMIAAGGVAGAW